MSEKTPIAVTSAPGARALDHQRRARITLGRERNDVVAPFRRGQRVGLRTLLQAACARPVQAPRRSAGRCRVTARLCARPSGVVARERRKESR